ncbi:MAG: LacI family DNA-binding transcriptional regulator [Candidatus Promineifilaceae bacterium]
MAVTIKDVARVAGVSHTTVSRALRNNPAISLATSESIKRVASEMGYVPNSAARGLKTKRSKTLGVIVRRIDDPFFGQVVNGIEDVLQSCGYSLFLAASNKDFAKEKEIFRNMSERRVDGVIICSTGISPEYREQLDRFGVPIVLVNNQAQNGGDCSVGHDDTFGAKQLAQHLLWLGHQSIAYIGNGNAGRTNTDRLLGYQQALTAAGIAVNPDFIVNASTGRAEGGTDAANRLLALDVLPTAIMCFNDMLALGAMFTLQRAGLQIPEECSITGFDNIALSAHVNPRLTTFDQPKYELGQAAARMMLRIVEKKEGTQTERVHLRGELTVRESTIRPNIK